MGESKVKTYKVTVSFELEISPDDLECEDGSSITPTDYAELFVEDALADLVEEWEVISLIPVVDNALDITAPVV